jgi:hypothetical protein
VGWDSGCANPPELWGTQRANYILTLNGTSNAVIDCLEITDHSGCVESHPNSSVACQRDTYPYGDWALIGIYAADSSNVTLRHLNIHGLAHTGIRAGRLTDWTVEDVRIARNGMAGWDGDLQEGVNLNSNQGTLTFRRLTVEWSGCAESYPGGQTNNCWGQSVGGYGDGFGQGGLTGGHWIIEDSVFRYNTQDGIDMLYVREANSQIEIRRTKSYGNAGDQMKVNGPARIENSLMISNCGFFNGKSFTYNVGDCRAGGSALVFSMRRGSKVSVVNSTLVGQGDCLLIVQCDTEALPTCDGSEVPIIQNNIFQGHQEFGTDDMTCDVWFDRDNFYQTQEDYNVIHPDTKLGEFQHGSHDIFQDPLFVNSNLETFDGHLQVGSPAINSGLPVNSLSGLIPSDDLTHATRPYGSGVDRGAYEYGATLPNLNPNPPDHAVHLIFIHHSTGENWLADENGGLGIALRDNNYFVSDTNYGWGPAYTDGTSTIGDHTDIGNWWEWFRGPNSSTYLNALYNEGDQHSSYSRLPTSPSGENEIIMFKSCFPNSALQDNPNDPVPPIDSNPLRGEGSGSEYHTVANAKGIYIDLLEYFRTRQDKLFIVITAPPLMANDTNTAEAANARAFNNWLVNEWLAGYPYKNVAVFDFYNVLTSNGGNADTNDAGWETGNHHRWWNGTIQHIQTVNYDMAAYPTGDSHPSEAGNLKATGEFLSLLNIAYHLWKEPCTTCPDTQISSGPTGTITYNNPTFTYTGTDDVTPTANLVYATYLQGYDSDWSSFSSSTSKSYSNLPNGSYTFQVKAKDEAGNEDPTPATTSFTVLIRVEEDNPAITYTGTWNTYTSASCSGGAMKYSGEKGAKAEFSFTGTGIKWIVTKAKMMGKAKVYLNGVYRGLVDLYSSSPAYQVVLQKPGLAPGNHTLRLEFSGQKNLLATGYYINIDAFEVIP